MRLLFASMVFCVMATAQEVAWIELRPNFAYKDLTKFCTNSTFPAKLHLSAEWNGSQATKAFLHSPDSSRPPSKIELNSTELSDLKLAVDGDQRVWILDLHLSRRLLDWVFYRTEHSFGSCWPTQTMTTVIPSPVTYTFGSSIPEGSIEAVSKVIRFSGTLKDGSLFEASLEWTEKPVLVTSQGGEK